MPHATSYVEMGFNIASDVAMTGLNFFGAGVLKNVKTGAKVTNTATKADTTLLGAESKVTTATPDFYVTAEGAGLPTSPNRINNILNNLDFSTPHNGAVFYSGPGNEALAVNYAAKNGGMLITNTTGGAVLQSVGRLPDSIYRLYWGGASSRFATQASGTVNAFVNGAAPNSIFNVYELNFKLGQLMDEYNNPKTNQERKNQLEKMIPLTQKVVKGKDDLNKIAASILSENPRYYELGEKLKAKKIREVEIQEFYQINIDSMAHAINLKKDLEYYTLFEKVANGTASDKEIQKFNLKNIEATKLANNDFATAFVYDSKNSNAAWVSGDIKTVTINLGHKNKTIKKSPVYALQVSSHEIIGHIDDKREVVNQGGKFAQSLKTSYMDRTNREYTDLLREKTAFYSGKSVGSIAVIGIINTSKYANGGWKNYKK